MTGKGSEIAQGQQCSVGVGCLFGPFAKAESLRGSGGKIVELEAWSNCKARALGIPAPDSHPLFRAQSLVCCQGSLQATFSHT